MDGGVEGWKGGGVEGRRGGRAEGWALCSALWIKQCLPKWSKVEPEPLGHEDQVAESGPVLPVCLAQRAPGATYGSL